MILYRAIAIEPPLNLDKLGVYWCSEKAKAYCYGVKKYMPFYYIYKAEIDNKYINVCKTKEVNERWPHEK